MRRALAVAALAALCARQSGAVPLPADEVAKLCNDAEGPAHCMRLVEAQQLCQPYGIQSLQLGCSCTLVPVGTAAELVERACADLQPLPASPPPTPANAAQIKENP